MNIRLQAGLFVAKLVAMVSAIGAAVGLGLTYLSREFGDTAVIIGICLTGTAALLIGAMHMLYNMRLDQLREAEKIREHLNNTASRR